MRHSSLRTASRHLRSISGSTDMGYRCDARRIQYVTEAYQTFWAHIPDSSLWWVIGVQRRKTSSQ